jgi:NADH-quinone oxidoreductase subunit I
MKQYFRNIFISLWTVLLGMKVTMTYFFKKPITVQYPKEKLPIPENYRGEINVTITTCSACLQCARACPIEAITIEVEGKGKERMIKKFDVDMNICMLCGLCERACPTEAVTLTQKYEVAIYNKEDQKLHFVLGEPIKANTEATKKKTS